MAKFAPVAPSHLLIEFAKADELGTYHLLLAHDIVKPQNYELYHDLFGMRTWDGIVILDNSIIELGNAVDLSIITEAAKIVRANCIVLPDVLEDSEATFQSISNSYDEWEKAFDKALGYGNYRFMFVPQGKTIEDFDTCAENLGQVSTRSAIWGIPRNLVKLHGSRVDAIMTCNSIEEDWPIHMLGFSDNLSDDIECALMQEVTGIDSAVPIRAATEGFTWYDLVAGAELPPRGDWWDNRSSFSSGMLNNLRAARRTFAGETENE